jgi:hypothetical protein
MGGRSMVMVISEDSTPMPVRVELGAASDEYTEITSGEIVEGDQVMVVVNTGQNVFGGGFGMMGGMRQITGGGGGRPPERE